MEPVCRLGEAAGVNKMEKIDKVLLVRYGGYLQTLVAKGDMKSATTQVYVSAVNAMMNYATRHRWESVSPIRQLIYCCAWTLRLLPD